MTGCLAGMLAIVVVFAAIAALSGTEGQDA